MSNNLKTRTFSDSIRTGLFKTIVNTRKLSHQAAKLSKRAAKAANSVRKDATHTAKQAWKADIS